MATSKKRVTVPGSEKQALAKAKVVGSVDPASRIEVTVVLRPRTSGEGALSSKAAHASAMAAGSAPNAERSYLSRAEFEAQRGADPKDVAAVEDFAHEHGLTVVDVSLAKRSIRLAGTVKDLTTAFEPKLKEARLAGRTIRTRTGGISVPPELARIVVAVLGFDNRPAAQPHFRFATEPAGKPSAKSAPAAKRATGAAGAAPAKAGAKATPHNAADGSFTPPQIAKLYGFPPALKGSGQCIALIELNDFDSNDPSMRPTGSGFTPADLKAYFKSLGLAAPKVTAIGVASDGSVGANMPGPDPNADGEVMLDIEVAAAVAPKAAIAVYFGLNTDNGILAAFNAALHDNVRRPSVISISWGSAEDFNTKQALDAFNQALQDAATLGVTVCCASGDDGSSDIRKPADRDGHPHVDFPASSPFALACGGTRLLGSGSSIASEVVWNQRNGGTGGGVSNAFARPAYQAKAKVPKSPKKKTGRGVPDVAGNADPGTGYQVRLVGGKSSVIGGTSAVAPLWAGLIALLNQKLAAQGKPPAGFINPLLYGLAPDAGAFRDILSGNNDIEGLGKYSAAKGWDPCTGLGTPQAAKLIALLA
jgi:kumamolisin